MCDILFGNHGNKLERNTSGILIDRNEGFNSLLLYCIVTCYFERMMEIFESLNSIPRSSYLWSKSFATCSFNIFCEWLKTFVTFVILRQQNLAPKGNKVYTITTIIYYVCTEKMFVKLFTSFLKLLKVEKFDGLEFLYAPIILNFCSMTLSFILNLFLLYKNHVILSTFIFHYAIIAKYESIVTKFWNKLAQEKDIVNKFKQATKQDLDNYNDVCSICLQEMERARITNCAHIFHTECLRKWIKISNYCPLCKSNFS